jgi:hypothetical protein
MPLAKAFTQEDVGTLVQFAHPAERIGLGRGEFLEVLGPDQLVGNVVGHIAQALSGRHCWPHPVVVCGAASADSTAD